MWLIIVCLYNIWRAVRWRRDQCTLPAALWFGKENSKWKLHNRLRHCSVISTTRSQILGGKHCYSTLLFYTPSVLNLMSLQSLLDKQDTYSVLFPGGRGGGEEGGEWRLIQYSPVCSSVNPAEDQCDQCDQLDQQQRVSTGAGPTGSWPPAISSPSGWARHPRRLPGPSWWSAADLWSLQAAQNKKQ